MELAFTMPIISSVGSEASPIRSYLYIFTLLTILFIIGKQMTSKLTVARIIDALTGKPLTSFGLSFKLFYCFKTFGRCSRQENLTAFH